MKFCVHVVQANASTPIGVEAEVPALAIAKIQDQIKRKKVLEIASPHPNWGHVLITGEVLRYTVMPYAAALNLGYLAD